MDGTSGTRGVGVGFCGFGWSTDSASSLFSKLEEKEKGLKGIFLFFYTSGKTRNLEVMI